MTSSNLTNKTCFLFILVNFVLLSFSVVSCKKGQTATGDDWYVGMLTRQDQILNYGENLQAQVRVMNGFTRMPGIKVKFEIITGGGTVSEPETLTDDDGLAKTTWTPGIGSFNPLLRASAYSGAGDLINSRDLHAYNFVPDKWNKVTNGLIPNASIMLDMVNDWNTGVTFMVGDMYKLYKQGSRYYRWDEIADPNLYYIKTVDMDKNGVIYAVSEEQEDNRSDIVKSTDHGSTWSLCTRPFEISEPDMRISICNDNSVWAYKYGQPVKFSKDQGQTWQTAGSGISAMNFADVFRLSDNSILFYGYGCGLKISNDEGQTWSSIPTPGTMWNLFVTDDDLIVICCTGTGFDVYTSGNKGASFTLAGSYPTSYFVPLKNFITRQKDNYFIIVPGYGVLETTDFTNMNAYYNTDLSNFFVDDKGVMMARSKDWQSIYYYQKSAK
ncbi:MAG TPA: hypothetical protein VMT63_08210 [Bacteroidales bacterium]|nr:hypothetical protein [Bacteroidales bacterium]